MNRPWEKVRAILEDALELAPAERERFVREACAGDAELECEVGQYLGYEDAANHALPVSAWTEQEGGDADAAPDPERIGGYRIVRRIGEGGMGVVYLAERADGEYRQEAALKVLGSSAPRQKLLRLFRNERQILAGLQHPNIVRLLGGGTDNGRIYYLMEYVEGVPITEYIRERGLTLRQRLELFCRVCDAVSYAHRKLIIHRDLKPGNVLVTAAGVPKLLDFGLAKAFEPEAGALQQSLSVGAMLTPAYASPEQIRGEHLGVASDLYSLGVLLYELLTDRNPHLEGEKSPLEVCRSVCDQDPRPPSHICRPELKRQLAGDLDAIVMMALRKEPERRYGSAEALRQDIERYLEGYAVKASHGSAWYRCRKYVVRHRWGVAASVLVGIAALAAGMAIWWEGRQAHRRFDDVRGLAHAVIFELHDAIAELPGSTPARELLVRRASEYLEKLAREAGGDAGLAREVALSYERVGDAQGNMGDSNLGQVSEALASYGRAAGILETLAARRPGDAALRRDYLRVAGRLATALGTKGQTESGLQLARKSMALAEAAFRASTGDPGATEDLAGAGGTLADMLTLLNRYGEAIPLRQRVIELYTTRAGQMPQNNEAQRTLALAHKKLGALYGVMGRLQECRNEYEAARAIDEARATREPDNPRTSLDLSYDYSDLGWLAARFKDYPDALKAHRRALAIREAALQADPQNVRAATSVASSTQRIGVVLLDMGDLAGALRQMQRAIDLYRKIAGPQSSSWDPVSKLAEAHAAAGVVYAAMADGSDAGSVARRQHAAQTATEYEAAVRLYEGLRDKGVLPGPGRGRAKELAGLAEGWRKVEAGTEGSQAGHGVH